VGRDDGCVEVEVGCDGCVEVEAEAGRVEVGRDDGCVEAEAAADTRAAGGVGVESAATAGAGFRSWRRGCGAGGGGGGMAHGGVAVAAW
jgi:hypothetical protein